MIYSYLMFISGHEHYLRLKVLRRYFQYISLGQPVCFALIKDGGKDHESAYLKNLKPVFVWEYTKTGKSILRPAFDQSDCKKAGPALILIERHLIMQFIKSRSTFHFRLCRQTCIKFYLQPFRDLDMIATSEHLNLLKLITPLRHI